VHEDDLAFRLAAGALRSDENPNLGLSFDDERFDGPSQRRVGTAPKISRDGGEVRIAEERFEWPQVKL
jgi:hypothetical protein